MQFYVHRINKEAIALQIQYQTRFNPEMECIFLLERHFQSSAAESHSIPQLRDALSDKYNIPAFELEPMLQPLADVEHYVLSNLNVNEEHLRFLFTSYGRRFDSLSRPLYAALKTHVRYGALPERERIAALRPTLARVLDVDASQLAGVEDLAGLMQYLLKGPAGENIKWVCTALYYAMDDYLEQLDIILRKATALFLEHLPETGICSRRPISAASRWCPA